MRTWRHGAGPCRAWNAGILVFGLLLVPYAQAQAKAQGICATGASQVNPLVSGVLAEPGSGGIGGTGAQARAPDQGGIGGTGIVGIITGFASICVNGVEVHFDTTTPVSEAGEPVSARRLAIGQLVAISANGSGAQVQARKIALIHIAVGPLSSVDPRTGEFSLLGQRGRALDPSSLESLIAGDWVRVSGQRLSSGAIAASRIERVASQSEVQLNGVIERVDGNAVFVGGTQVHLELPPASSGPVVGSEITVAGAWDGRVVRARQAVLEPTRTAMGAVGQVVLSGYVHALGDRSLSLGLGDLVMGPDAQVVGAHGGTLAIDQHVQVTGLLGTDRRITVDRVVIGESPSHGGGAGAGALPGARVRLGERNPREGEDRSGRSGSQEHGSGHSGTSDGGEGSSGAGESGDSGGSEGSEGSDSAGGSDGSGDSGSSGGSDHSGGEGSESGGEGNGRDN
jgi:hypothetical protein